jgi:thiamine biosynthesis lipoprotein
MIGTFITVTVYAESEQAAAQAINASFAEMTRLGDELSHYSKTNRVYELNTQGFMNPVELTPDLSYVINASLYYSELSDGAFDVTVQPLVLLWERLKRGEPAPTREEISETLTHIGYASLSYNGSHAWFTRPNMSVTFGGIAKGYMVDKGLAVLCEHGIEHALINAGGQVGALGGKKDGSKWRIALKNPRNSSDYITVIQLKDGSVATSGDYERYYTPDMKAHHIMNPKTGYSATELMSATVVTKTGTDADALSTAVFVLGPDKGIQLAEKLPDTEALVITENKTIKKTNGFTF